LLTNFDETALPRAIADQCFTALSTSPAQTLHKELSCAMFAACNFSASFKLKASQTFASEYVQSKAKVSLQFVIGSEFTNDSKFAVAIEVAKFKYRLGALSK
jgi:hypothetical protein